MVQLSHQCVFLHGYHQCSLPCQIQVPSLATGDHRLIPHIFGKGDTSGEDRRAMMANVMTPMKGSVAFKKLAKRQARSRVVLQT